MRRLLRNQWFLVYLANILKKIEDKTIEKIVDKTLCTTRLLVRQCNGEKRVITLYCTVTEFSRCSRVADGVTMTAKDRRYTASGRNVSGLKNLTCFCTSERRFGEHRSFLQRPSASVETPNICLFIFRAHPPSHLSGSFTMHIIDSSS